MPLATADNSTPAVKTASEPRTETQKGADKTNWEWVEIPQHDIFGDTFSGIGVNFEKFEAGKRYFLDPDLARTVRERLAIRQRADMRILQPNKDEKLRAIQIARGTEVSI